MDLEAFERRQANPENHDALANASIFSTADNKLIANQRDALRLPASFPDVLNSNQWSQSDPQPVSPEHRGENLPPPPTDPLLPGLPPPSRGHRQIIHITPGRYIDIPYPEDISIRNGVTYGHVSIKVPGWIPGAHPYRNR